MLKHYLLIALRTLRRNRIQTLVNLVGLSVGMATCALILMLVYHEWSFDRFHEHAGSIYRVYLAYQRPDGTEGLQTMMEPDFTPDLAASFPTIERATRLVTGQVDLDVGDQSFRHQLAEVDTDFFTMFSFPLLAGEAPGMLDAPGEMVITRSLAESMFGAGDGHWQQALGKTVSIGRGDDTFDFAVAGVLDDFPDNSSITFDAAISFENYSRLRIGGNNWGGRTSTYVQPAAGVDAATLQASLKPFAERRFGPYVDALIDAGFLAEGDDTYALRLQPLLALHRTPAIDVPYEVPPHDPTYSYILLGIGLLVLLIACINFMTLSVGQSALRAREVGMRKVLGADRRQLMRQYWGESLVMAVIAVLLAVGLTVLALPFFNEMAQSSLKLSTIPPVMAVLGVLALVALVGLVAGGYPAAVLSAFRPARVLKGSVRTPGRGRLTQGLVVLQYVISIGLIVATVVMAQQMRFVSHLDLGYDADLVVAVNANPVPHANADAVLERFRAALMQHDDVEGVARAGYTFTRGSDRITWQDAGGVTRSAYNFGAGYNYVDVMGMTVVDGRNFSRDYPSDPEHAILVNEALVRAFGLQDPVGKKLTGWMDSFYDEAPTIIGVVKDFRFQSLHEAVAPAVLNMHPDYYGYMGAILVRIRPGHVTPALAQIESTWKNVVPGSPFSYSFVDDDVARQYAGEERWQGIVSAAAGLAILIACMGLFGLALLSVTRRVKEIGIRKVMGASVGRLALMVSSEFAILVVVAGVLAAAPAYFAMQAWLARFDAHVTMGPGAFVAGAAIALAIAMATVSFHAVRAARSNPVRTLRYE